MKQIEQHPQYLRSTAAEPPISDEEARFAEAYDPAICRINGGLIADVRAPDDAWGRVYYYPVGRMYWRLTPLMSQFLRPLNSR